ncbi:hypothetical protein [Pimelobacter simplex]|uniref:hypothetical protein n=1 Tax=Nocardioides simplex TaxID=2045 RepID=UPI00215053C0|nr:hypothetical protein [Pimelobacter simplex]UUW87389.1 hypothetical protein M0M43_16740 [Pimelobacter simplex]UUW96894.1 hypothetical protein M0M48_05385 [Pimelobacter simplex]
MNLKPYAKAVVAGVVTLGAGLGTALTDGHVSAVEWCTIIPATVVAVGAVFGIRNTPA